MILHPVFRCCWERLSDILEGLRVLANIVATKKMKSVDTNWAPAKWRTKMSLSEDRSARGSSILHLKQNPLWASSCPTLYPGNHHFQANISKESPTLTLSIPSLITPRLTLFQPNCHPETVVSRVTSTSVLWNPRRALPSSSWLQPTLTRLLTPPLSFLNKLFHWHRI